MDFTTERETFVRYNRWAVSAIRISGRFMLVGAAGIVVGVVLLAIAIAGPKDTVLPEIVTQAVLYVWVITVVGLKLCGIAHVFPQAYVAAGPGGVRFCLLDKNGLVWTPLPEQRFSWEQISGISYDRSRRVCRFRAGNQDYTLSDFNSPSPPTVANLLLEWKGAVRG